jgi:predicted nucleic acid-binding protein
MNVVDSSGWLEYFAAGPNTSFFSPPIEKLNELIVPSLSLYEVFRRILQQRSENEALQAVAVMQQGKIVDLDPRIALHAARLSLKHELPMADSVMLSTAVEYDAIFWTQDSHFFGISGVEYCKAVKERRSPSPT